MKKIKFFFTFFLGVISVFLFFYVKNQVMSFTESDENEALSENIINTPSDLSAKIYDKMEKNEKLFLPNPQKIDDLSTLPANVWVKTTFGLHNNQSTCMIDADVSGNFSNKQNGKPHVARIVVTDFSSEESRIECSKRAMEEVLPFLLRGAFSGIVKAKIYDEGTIFKTFEKKEIIEAAKQNAPLVFDGGFLFETLNIGVLLTPNRFEVYITDCANVKCGE
jgi:hypothetical protein